MSYVYESPIAKGYMKIPVTVKKHNQIFPLRKRKIGANVEYYYQPESQTMKIQYFTSAWAKAAIITLGFIPSIFLQGIPQTIRDTADLIYERRRGKFVEDTLWLGHEKPHKGLADHLSRYIEGVANEKANS